MASLGAMRDEFQDHFVRDEDYDEEDFGYDGVYSDGTSIASRRRRRDYGYGYSDDDDAYDYDGEEEEEEDRGFEEGYQEKGNEESSISSPIEDLSPEDAALKAKVEAFKDFVDTSHRNMSSHYSKSLPGDERRMKDRPQRLVSNCIDEEIPADAGVFVVNQRKFAEVQSEIFRRNAKQQKRLLAASIDYVNGLVDLDFSELTNPSVHKEKSSLWISDKAKHSPFVLWDRATTSKTAEMKVDTAIGFPSVNQMKNQKTREPLQDTVVESGYMVTAMKPEGIRVHGEYGGKEGKILKPGEAIFFGEAMVRSKGNYMRPVWFRLVSSKPSIKTDTGTSVAELEVKMIPLKPRATGSSLAEFSGKGKRSVRITNNIEETTDGEKKVRNRNVCATLDLSFS